MWHEDPARVRPMLASLGVAPQSTTDYAYEPKYDGIRALVSITPGSTRARRSSRHSGLHVQIWSRLGNDKTAQFPELVEALAAAFGRRRAPLLLDGEIVALNAAGHPVSFLQLQPRIHRRSTRQADAPVPVAFIAFDLLRDGDEDLRGLSLRSRRSRLERACAVLPAPTTGPVRMSEQVVGSPGSLEARARAEGWEGLIAKRLDSRYLSGARSGDWRKLKLVKTQSCIVGGWTSPKGTRARFGALLLGVRDDSGALRFVGQVGSGFSDAEIERVWKTLQRIAAKTSPFAAPLLGRDRRHWTTPSLVAEVKFTEWTPDGRLRHPTYLGLRDDVVVEHVRREPQPTSGTPAALASPQTGTLPAQLDTLQTRSGAGTLKLPDGGTLAVTNLRKLFWPEPRITKGDLFRYYLQVADVLLPVLDDRPLVLKRYPDGIARESFYQHRAATQVPAGVRVETMDTVDGARPHIIGGSVASLLYTVQLAAISHDPWLSRVTAPDHPDYVVFDLDPADGTPFRQVLDLALYVRRELDALGAPVFPKTSGSRGLHLYVPLPARTPFEASLLYAQIIATIVVKKHPSLATIERSVRARGRRIYIDFLQNARGKTLASAYSARATAWAGVSAPLTWKEVEDGVMPDAFTVTTMPARLQQVGDLWAALRRAPGADLRAVMKYAEPR